jgi:hypothetical protein
MIDGLYDATRVIAYFLWEYSGNDDALCHWYCAEDTACYFQESGIFSVEDIENIKRKGLYSEEYIAFVRHIAFRIYTYTLNENCRTNWFTTERLLYNVEWCAAITKLASIYDAEKGNCELTKKIISSKVKKFYG